MSAAATRDDVIVATSAGTRLNFVFHASKVSNLAYQMDCLAGIIGCSRAAYQELWAKELGGLSKDDEQALERWSALKFLYTGMAERQDSADPSGVGLPLQPSGWSLGRIQRSAGYRSDSLDGLQRELSLFMSLADAERARGLMQQFMPRFESFWKKAAPGLRESADGFALAMSTEMRGIVERVANFYGASLPLQAEIGFDLVARPPHDSGTRGELVANRSLLEVVQGEKPSERLFVVLHELFHYLHWSASRKALSDLALRILDTDDPVAVPAYGLLDEAVAAAIGSGIIRRMADPENHRKRVGKSLGFYGDPQVDVVAQAFLPALEPYLNAGGSIHDPAFAAQYVDTVRKAFADGIPPRAYLLNLACAHEPELKGSYAALTEALRPTQRPASPSLEPRAVKQVLGSRTRWTHVLLVRTSEAKTLTALTPWVEKMHAQAIERRARKGGRFAYVTVGKGKAPVFVFVAPDDAEMTLLIRKFLELTKTSHGVIDA